MTRDESKQAFRTQPHATARVLTAGITVGLIAGLVMMLVAMIRSAWTGLGVWLPPKLIAGVYLGVEALLGNEGVVVIGLLTHLLVAAAFGALFAVLLGARRYLPTALFFGVVYGIGVWAFMLYVVLPLANPTMAARAAMNFTWFFLYHVVYGLLVGFAPWVAQRFEQQRQAPIGALPVPQ